MQASESGSGSGLVRVARARRSPVITKHTRRDGQARGQLMGQGLDQWGPWAGAGCDGGDHSSGWGQAEPRLGAAPTGGGGVSPGCVASKSALCPSSQTCRTKNAVLFFFFLYKYLKKVFLEITKMTVSSRGCLLLFIEDIRLGSHLDFFSRGDKIQTKDLQLPTVLLHAVPRDAGTVLP